MSITVKLVLYGWVPLMVLLFSSMHPRKATLVTVIGGILLLPAASLENPLLSSYNQHTAIALALLLGRLVERYDNEASFHFEIYDIPMFLWCFVSPFASSLSNGLGVNDGLSTMLDRILSWGVVYWAGRRYFHSFDSLRELTKGIIIGGLVYVPLALFEVRMSPQLSNIVYDFFPHSFLQHARYGGYRPIIFMSHGLMVSLWLAASFTVAFWMWRSKKIKQIYGFPIGLCVLMLFVTGILAKSANGWFFILMGMLSYTYFSSSKKVSLFRLSVLLIPLYIILRLSETVSVELIQRATSFIFDDERVSSLSVRLMQEGLFGAKTLGTRPWFGWAWMGRAWPVNVYTGERLISMVDSLFIIYLGTSGLFGLTSIFCAMLLGPWRIFRSYSSKFSKIKTTIEENGPEPIIVSLIVVFFMLDSLLNAMVNPIYILSAAAITSFCSETCSVRSGKEEKLTISSV